MKSALKADKAANSLKFSRIAYILYIILVLYQFITGNYEWAIANLGIALVFDPFAPVTWQNRTKAQKATLLIHLTILVAGVFFLIFR